MLVEPMIHGDYDKFNSNSGASKGESVPDFFSHWTWAMSGGEHLVCDLQGHRGRPGGPTAAGSDVYYMLTDPVVLSRKQQFGCTDLGQQGIETWFANHKCNELCRGHGLNHQVPKRRNHHYALRRGTTYRPEHGMWA
eukprot:203148-Amphidinium_carterae.1